MIGVLGLGARKLKRVRLEAILTCPAYIFIKAGTTVDVLDRHGIKEPWGAPAVKIDYQGNPYWIWPEEIKIFSPLELLAECAE